MSSVRIHPLVAREMLDEMGLFRRTASTFFSGCDLSRCPFHRPPMATAVQSLLLAWCLLSCHAKGQKVPISPAAGSSRASDDKPESDSSTHRAVDLRPGRYVHAVDLAENLRQFSQEHQRRLPPTTAVPVVTTEEVTLAPALEISTESSGSTNTPPASLSTEEDAATTAQQVGSTTPSPAPSTPGQALIANGATPTEPTQTTTHTTTDTGELEAEDGDIALAIGTPTPFHNAELIKSTPKPRRTTPRTPQVTGQSSFVQNDQQMIVTNSFLSPPLVIEGSIFPQEPTEKPSIVVHSPPSPSLSADSNQNTNCCTCHNSSVTQSELSTVDIASVANLSTSYVQIQSFPPYPIADQINSANSVVVIQKPALKPFSPVQQPIPLSTNYATLPLVIPHKIPPIIKYSAFLKPVYWKLAKMGLVKGAAIPIAIATALGVAGLKKKVAPVSEHIEMEYQTPPKFAYPPLPLVYTPLYYSAPKKPNYHQPYKRKPPSYKRIPKKQPPK